MYKFFGHLKTVIIHKYWVGRLCFYCGLYKQGVLHDMSKFSPTEFWESVKYWSGVRSPIDACKEENGVSFDGNTTKGVIHITANIGVIILTQILLVTKCLGNMLLS